MQHKGDWKEATRLMVQAAQNLEKAGAGFVLICTNTMHKMAQDVQAAISIPLVHIADPTGKAIQQQGIKKIALLGTKYTMEHDFYKGRLITDFGLEVVVPDEKGRQIVHDIIYNELCLGVIKDSSRAKYKKVIEGLKQQGVKGVILGCTEITLLIGQTDTDLPIFDTTRIHAEAAVDLALH